MNRTRFVGSAAAALFALTFLPAPADAESWRAFSKLIGDSDYIAQYQVLVRPPDPEQLKLGVDASEQIVGRRLVRVYWKSKGFEDSLLPRHDKPWGASDYNRKTDSIRTEFVFFGRGQHLWTPKSEGGVIQYPGSTAWERIGDEFSGSDVEFDDLLQRAAALKATGAKFEGKLEMSVFGEKRLAK